MPLPPQAAGAPNAGRRSLPTYYTPNTQHARFCSLLFSPRCFFLFSFSGPSRGAGHSFWGCACDDVHSGHGCARGARATKKTHPPTTKKTPCFILCARPYILLAPLSLSPSTKKTTLLFPKHLEPAPPPSQLGDQREILCSARRVARTYFARFFGVRACVCAPF